MKCNIESCQKHQDCGILDITNKIPKDRYSCSYYKSIKEPKKYNTNKIYIPPQKVK